MWQRSDVYLLNLGTYKALPKLDVVTPCLVLGVSCLTQYLTAVPDVKFIHVSYIPDAVLLL